MTLNVFALSVYFCSARSGTYRSTSNYIRMFLVEVLLKFGQLIQVPFLFCKFLSRISKFLPRERSTSTSSKTRGSKPRQKRTLYTMQEKHFGLPEGLHHYLRSLPVKFTIQGHKRYLLKFQDTRTSKTILQAADATICLATILIRNLRQRVFPISIQCNQIASYNK